MPCSQTGSTANHPMTSMESSMAEIIGIARPRWYTARSQVVFASQPLMTAVLGMGCIGPGTQSLGAWGLGGLGARGWSPYQGPQGRVVPVEPLAPCEPCSPGAPVPVGLPCMRACASTWSSTHGSGGGVRLTGSSACCALDAHSQYWRSGGWRCHTIVGPSVPVVCSCASVVTGALQVSNPVPHLQAPGGPPQGPSLHGRAHPAGPAVGGGSRTPHIRVHATLHPHRPRQRLPCTYSPRQRRVYGSMM